MATEWALARVSLLHLVKVFVQATVACDELNCGSVVFLVIFESVEITNDFSLFVAENHFGVSGSIMFPFFFIESGNFVVNLFLDI